MSIKIMSRVWETSELGGTELLCLLAIADFCDDSGTAYPSIATLAKRMRMSERNTHYLVAKVEASGELVVERNKGPKGCNLFRVQTLQGGAKIALQSLHRGAMDGAKGVQPTAPEPSLNRHEREDAREIRDANSSHRGRSGQIAAWLIGEGVKVTSQHPDLLAWVDELKATDEQLREALERCRLQKPAPEKIPARYFDTTLRGVLKPKPQAAPVERKPVDAWWTSDGGIDRKARELGIFAGTSDTYQALKDKCFAKIREQEGRSA